MFIRSDVPGVKNRESRKYGKKSLKNMFLDDWSMVLVLDDREDVWMTSTQHRHLLQVLRQPNVVICLALLTETS